MVYMATAGTCVQVDQAGRLFLHRTWLINQRCILSRLALFPIRYIIIAFVTNAKKQ